MSQQTTSPIEAGFIAGTLGHTNDGLKPIELLRIGDCVLSKPEFSESSAVPSYKRVTNTFRFERKWVATLAWFQRSDEDPPNSRARRYDEVFVAPDQLVWVDRYGWLPVKRLHEPTKMHWHLLAFEDYECSLFRLADGSACRIGNVMDCFCTNQEGVVYADYGDRPLEEGFLWDVKVSPPQKLPNSFVGFDMDEWLVQPADEPYCFTTTVFNIEVEEFRTYYIGESGLWVHDGSINRAPVVPPSRFSVGIFPPDDSWPKFD